MDQENEKFYHFNHHATDGVCVIFNNKGNRMMLNRNRDGLTESPHPIDKITADISEGEITKTTYDSNLRGNRRDVLGTFYDLTCVTPDAARLLLLNGNVRSISEWLDVQRDLDKEVD